MRELDAFSCLCYWLSPIITDHKPLIAYLQQASTQAQAWTKLIYLASQHLVTPALYPIACTKNLLHYIPADIQHYLKTIHRLNSQRNQTLLAQTLTIIDILNTIAIEPLALKGIASLLNTLYPDIGMRMLGDIDLLIPTTRLAEAVAILHANGYTDAEENTLEQYHSHHHAIPLIKTGELAAVELHHALIPSYNKITLLDTAQCWQQAQRLTVIKQRCFILEIDDRLLHNFYHSQYQDHNYLYGKLSPRQALEWIYLHRHDAAVINQANCIERVRQQHLLTAFTAYQLSLQFYFKQPVATILNININSRLQYWRERLRRRYRVFNYIHTVLVFIIMSLLYLSAFKTASIRSRYPHLSVWAGRKLWLCKLRKYLKRINSPLL